MTWTMGMCMECLVRESSRVGMALGGTLHTAARFMKCLKQAFRNVYISYHTSTSEWYIPCLFIGVRPDVLIRIFKAFLKHFWRRKKEEEKNVSEYGQADVVLGLFPNYVI